ncbi:hypothetical protein MKUB_13950 [Mycobacterium kubicae]|uniref:Proline rich protein n=1 Tax=Mycobacterium kubicae TaxID=120959 RepID=A0AAX1JFI1_9MYCO|nr:hypothetical protein [Mycobacterium kubicae]MCV7095748.1 hypothetical protein [Mycobacterium kubicae]ORV99698.1 hypothetical protein AWC13_09935 [Mycobacterium kubicae]QPI39340.1 hypothetical protein I2456_07680 [Mycobacterium kubicae]GFG63905.1 hypothetical protein MKUB_13950 [Mycobacterium kubicae]
MARLSLNILPKRVQEAQRRVPDHLFGGRVRTSTLVLIVAFLAVWWVYEAYRPEPPAKTNTPPAQVVPPGYVPDPDYTWVPRTRVNQPTQAPRTTTTTPRPTTTPPPTTTTTTTSPPFTLPTPPCLLPPPFCPATSTPSPPPGQLPGPGPTPTSSPPAS